MVSNRTIQNLINKKGNHFITITLPTHKKGEEAKQDPIRFKNQLSEVETKLKEKGVKEAEIEELLGEPRSLLEKPLFWAHAELGLAVYISDDFFEVYKLPYEVEEMVYINNHFLITPVLPMTSMEGSYCVLAISRQQMRLLQCTRTTVQDITPEGIPTSVTDYLEIEPEKQLQFHTGAAGQSAVFFGHNSNEEDKMVVVEQYFREFEKEITPALRERKDPLVMVGLAENASLYKKVNRYKRMMDTAVEHNPDVLSDKELRDKGWNIIKNHFLKDMYHSLETFSDKQTDRVSNNLGDIAEATMMGKSRAIFISRGEKKWGIYDEENNAVHYSNGPNGHDIELLNWLSITAHKNGGKVYILPKEEMPLHSTVAAEYRF